MVLTGRQRIDLGQFAEGISSSALARFKGLLATREVMLEVAFKSKALPAVRTSVTFFPFHMHLTFVIFQSHVILEAAATVAALVRLVPCVNVPVIF